VNSESEGAKQASEKNQVYFRCLVDRRGEGASFKESAPSAEIHPSWMIEWPTNITTRRVESGSETEGADRASNIYRPETKFTFFASWIGEEEDLRRLHLQDLLQLCVSGLCVCWEAA